MRFNWLEDMEKKGKLGAAETVPRIPGNKDYEKMWHGNIKLHSRLCYSRSCIAMLCFLFVFASLAKVQPPFPVEGGFVLLQC
jgi:hypothetical protein